MTLFSETVMDQINELETTFKVLAHRLPEATELMESSGRPVPEGLIRELAKSTQRFEEIKGEVLELAEPVPGLPPKSELGSIEDLRSFMKSVSDTVEKQTAHRNTQQAACGVLEKVLTITHVNGIEFAPLVACQAKARELHGSIAAAAWPDLHPEADSLARGQHIFSELVKFVSFHHTLDDEEWERLQNVLTQLGKPMGLAASRGKLVMSTSASPLAAVRVSVTQPETGSEPQETIGQTEKVAAKEVIPARVENQPEDGEGTPNLVALATDASSPGAPKTAGGPATELNDRQLPNGPAPEPVGEPSPGAAISRDQISSFAALEASGSVTAETTFDGTLDDIRYMLILDLIDSKGMANELSSKITAASMAAVGGDKKTAADLLRSFIAEVNAETGTRISGAAPELLLTDANGLLNQLQ